MNLNSNPLKNVFLILFIFSMISCEEENENKTNETMLVGTVNENMFHKNLSADFSMSYVWDTCGYGEGKDSLDLLNDGIYDIQFTARFLDYEAFLNCCGYADCYPSGLVYKISSLNEIEIATCHVPLTDSYSLTYADTLSVGCRLDTIRSWSTITPVWSMDYGSERSGPWYYVSNDSYMGIRMGDSTGYKYGWIRIGIKSDYNLVFKEYAIEK